MDFLWLERVVLCYGQLDRVGAKSGLVLQTNRLVDQFLVICKGHAFPIADHRVLEWFATEHELGA